MKLARTNKAENIWVLIYTKARQEIKANENLQKQGFKTFLPLISPNNKDSGINYPVPIFPRYLFAQINLTSDNWTVINSSYGVSQIVMFSEEFTPIPNNIIKFIQNKLDESGIYKEEVLEVDYQKGDSVYIKDGGFAGVDAIFLSKKSKDRVRLLLKLLNTNIVTEIKESNIDSKKIIKNFKF
jgi:transcriptional antiterminator RfaH